MIIESILTDELEKILTESKDNPLEFLDEYLASRRGISLEEAKSLLNLVETTGEETFDKINGRTKEYIEKAAGVAKKSSDVINNKAKQVKSDMSLSPEERTTTIGKLMGNRKGVEAWLGKTEKGIKDVGAKYHEKFKNLSDKQKMMIAGAAIGIPVLAGGLHALARHRRKKRMEDKNEDE
jgi:hypothetical protein